MITTFKDIFRKSFLEGYSGQLTTRDIVVAFLITCLLALYIFFVYKFITRKTFYSKNMNIALVALAIITSAVILSIQSSIVISLGMVGALSIVRFRTAIKDPLDLVFLFWAISVGIICGAGFANIAAILSILLTVVIVLLNKLPTKILPMMLVVNASELDKKKDIISVVKKFSKYYKIKALNHSQAGVNMVVEVQPNGDVEFINELNQIPGIESVSLLSHDGEVTY